MLNPRNDPKVNSILECIAQGQLRKAMNKVNTQLSISENTKYLCLKALVFQKLKKNNEAMEIAKKIRNLVIDDQDNLDILTVVFKNMKRLDMVTELYQETYDKYPIEERGKNLYNAMSSEFKFGEQAKLALRLHKAFDTDEFAEWAAFSMLVLAEVDSRQHGMVEIADLLFQKIKRKEGFRYTNTFFRLDLMIQEKLKLYSEVIHLLNSHTEIVTDYVERSTMIAKFYRYRAEYVHSLNLYHSMLSLNLSDQTARDLWPVTLDYIDLIFDILKQSVEGSTRFNPSGPIDPSNYAIKAVDAGSKTNLWKPFVGNESIIGVLATALANIKYTRDTVSGRGPLVDLIKRQSFLAEMEFKRRLIFWNFNQGTEEYKDENESGGIFMNLIMKYLTIYYEVPTTPEELIPYLYMVNVTQLIALRDKVNLFQEKILEISTNKMKCLRSTLCFTKILRLLGCFSPPLVKSSGQLWETCFGLLRKYLEYCDVEPLPRKGEAKIADELVLIAVEVLLQDKHFARNEVEGESGLELELDCFPNLSPRLLYAQTVLNLAVEKSPYNPQLKLTLMWIHSFGKNVTSAERIYNSMDLKATLVDKQSWIYFNLLSEGPIYLRKLENLCKSFRSFYKSAHFEMLPNITKAYQKQSIEEVKVMFIQKTQADNSLYQVLVQHEFLIISVMKSVNYPGQGFAKVLRDHLNIINNEMNLPSLKHYHLTADPSVIYECGVLKIKSSRDIKSKIPYDPKNISEDPFRHRKRPELDCYGKYKNFRWVRIESLRFKLILDVVERNTDDLENELGILHNELNGLGLLAKPALKKYAGLKPVSRDPSAIKEAVQQVREQNKGSEAPFTGKFSSEAEFLEHNKHMQGYFWKYQLMLFEGAFRLINAHPSNEEASKEPKEPEYEFTFLLTSYPHVLRHFEILNLMLKDMETLMIPREDYLKNLKLGLSKINTSLDEDQKVEEEEEDLSCFPGMLAVIREFLLGPMASSLMLNCSFSALAPTKQIHPDDYNLVNNLKKIIQDFNVLLAQILNNVRDYLEIQMKKSFYEGLARAHIASKEFRQFSTVFNHNFVEFTVEEIAKNHCDEVRQLLDLVRILIEVPRPST